MLFELFLNAETCLDWHVDRLAPISGFTQTSRTKAEGKDEVAYFSHPFEFDLYYKNDEDNFINRGLTIRLYRLNT